MTETISGNQKIIELYFKNILDTLSSRNPQKIKTRALLEFMQTIQGKNKTNSNNGICRLQYFLNSFIEIMALLSANPDKITLIGEQYKLIRNGVGDDEPDFVFKFLDESTATFEVKMYFSEASYQKNLSKTNFHKADYCIFYSISDRNWFFTLKNEAYTKIYSAKDFIKLDSKLAELVLPVSISRIKFNLDPSLSYNDVPDEVTYTFYNN